MSISRLTVDELVTRLSEKAGVTADQTRALLQAQAELACEYAAAEYPVPGIGVLKMIDSTPRTMVMAFGPKKGQAITIPARKKLHFRVCKIVKDIVLRRTLTAMPDLFDPHFFDDVVSAG